MIASTNPTPSSAACGNTEIGMAFRGRCRGGRRTAAERRGHRRPRVRTGRPNSRCRAWGRGAALVRSPASWLIDLSSRCSPEGERTHVHDRSATVHREHCAVDVRRGRRGEPRHGLGHLLGLRRAPRWDMCGRDGVGAVAVDSPGRGQRVHLPIGHRGANPSRAHAVGAHPARTVVEGDALREHDQAGLRRAVGGGRGVGPKACQRRDRDDRTAHLE